MNGRSRRPAGRPRADPGSSPLAIVHIARRAGSGRGETQGPTAATRPPDRARPTWFGPCWDRPRRFSAYAMKPSPTRSGALASASAERFYLDVLNTVKKAGVPFLVGGTYAVNSHTRVVRQTKDLDIFCRAGDFPKVLEHGVAAGFKAEVFDERWIAKLKRGRFFVDVIFGSVNAVTAVTDQWFAASHPGTVLGVSVQLLPPTELIWSKAFIQDRRRYDGSDVAHIILIKHAEVDWKRLLSYFEQYWEILFMHLLNFRFIYPSERELIPRWLLDELLERLRRQLEMPLPTKRTCRGRLLSPGDYDIDVKDWGFGDLIG